jgi:hypothetical protein
MQEITSAHAVPGAPGARAPANFAVHRAAAAGSFLVESPVETVFPLYGPAQEMRWDATWRPAWIFPEKAMAEASTPERGWVFTTGRGAGEERVWYVERFDTVGHQAVYLVHWPQHLLYRIEITAAPAGEVAPESGRTLTKVRYEFVGLSEEGNAEARARAGDPRDFAKEMRHWATLITDCLGRGEATR